MKRHNPWIVDLTQEVYLFLRWHMWMTILTNWFGLSQQRAAKTTRVIAQYCFTWWLGRIIGRTVYRDRPCVRKLIYVGYQSPAIEDDDSFFKLGKFYTGLTFNGATYAIERYSRRVGCVYFEIAD